MDCRGTDLWGVDVTEGVYCEPETRSQQDSYACSLSHHPPARPWPVRIQNNAGLVGRWRALCDMVSTLAMHTSTRDADAKVLVVGSITHTTKTCTESEEIRGAYDPRSH